MGTVLVVVKPLDRYILALCVEAEEFRVRSYDEGLECGGEFFRPGSRA